MKENTAATKLLISELVMYKNKYKSFTYTEASADTGMSINTIKAWEDGKVDSFILTAYYYSKVSIACDDTESDLLRIGIIDTMRRSTRQMIFNRIDPTGSIRQDIGHNEYQE